MMAAIIRQVPGIIGAVFGYIVLKLFGLLGFQSLAGEIVVFLVAVIVVALIADRAMRRYEAAKL
jgi:ABC-type phosphate transport system permease subunit